jgi:hypothetical protein
MLWHMYKLRSVLRCPDVAAIIGAASYLWALSEALIRNVTTV